MRNSLILGMATMIGLLLVSSTFVANVYATTWVGNDNGEIDCSATNSCTPDSGDVRISTGISTTISYTGGNGYISLQYNPDRATTISYQTHNSNGHPDWFQTGIIADKSTSCAKLTVQVWDTNNNNLDWSWFSNSGSCTTVADLLTTDGSGSASWGIQEDTDSNGYVSEVDFAVIGGTSGGGSYYLSAYPESGGNWYWLRSNACWCGTGLQTASFSAGAGTLDYASNGDLYSWSPPTSISTGENSNMDYGCFSGSGTTYMSQSFGLSGHC